MRCNPEFSPRTLLIAVALLSAWCLFVMAAT